MSPREKVELGEPCDTCAVNTAEHVDGDWALCRRCHAEHWADIHAEAAQDERSDEA